MTLPAAPKPGLKASLFLLSTATLIFEVDLTRLFSVAQFYHFAFMIVSVALLGLGASGTALVIFPAWRRAGPARALRGAALGMAGSILGSYLITNHLPFDSYSIAWDRRQIFILILHYLALAAPFFFGGMALGVLLTAFPQAVAGLYAVNLLGAAAGCVIALLAPPLLGAEGMVSLSSALAALATLTGEKSRPRLAILASLGLLAFSLLDLSTRLRGRPLPFLDLRLSPYKSLSYALQYPDAKTLSRRWNAFSRVDVVRSASIHSLPGLSYRYTQPLPPLDGLFVDGDDLSPIPQTEAEADFLDYLPNALAFHLRPAAEALILEPRGGLDVLLALHSAAQQVTVVEMNPLIVAAVPVYRDPRLQVIIESERSYLRRAAASYDVILISLTSTFHPIGSGAYTLMEDYRYTLEAFQDALAHLKPAGLLVATRWLQDPPSEDLRLFALATTALESAAGNPREQLIALRGYNTVTLLLKKRAYTAEELARVRSFAAERAFDLAYAPGIQPEETNVYNVLNVSRYYQTYRALLEAQPRQAFYAAYEYDVRPPTDNHPFFGHYFKWKQAPRILAQFAQTWQPFGGAGYFVILALLLLSTLLAGLLILLPVGLRRMQRENAAPFATRHLFYFGLLGMAFLLVEMPLLQRFILYLGQPAYAFTLVLFSLLCFSGLGSRMSERLPLRRALPLLAGMLALLPLLLPRLFALTLGLPLAFRLGLTVLVLAPCGFLMGIPFPAGIRSMTHRLSRPASRLEIAWVWAINGAASVLASILAALLALTFGFAQTLYVGAAGYGGAWLTAWAWEDALPPRHPSGARKTPRPGCKPSTPHSA